MKKYIASIDQGTTSTRMILFDEEGRPVSDHQLEHQQIYPKPGWVEHNAAEIWERTKEVITACIAKSKISVDSIAGIGITNQRETTVVWNPKTGEPLCNAIVWQDTRTAGLVSKLRSQVGEERLREMTGLPPATYFSGPKVRWILENIPGVEKAAIRGEAVFGTIDSWLIWNLTGGKNGGSHITDVTNASRTLMFNLESLNWDEELTKAIGVPPEMLPEIRPSIPENEIYGLTKKDGPFGAEIPVAGALGDQQAALFGQACFQAGDSKNTYGTGCFMLLNTGTEIVHSKYGLITTVAYQFGKKKPTYALEGSIAIAGALVQWLRDNLGLIKSAPEVDELASKVSDSGGVYIVPAFSGLFAPHWRVDARGVVTGLTRYANKNHLARAVLEASAYQTREIFDAMQADSGISISSLKVDGGMVQSEPLMQFQSDILNIPVIRPVVTETTALGSAYAAGLATGFWNDIDTLSGQWAENKRWTPNMSEEKRKEGYEYWKKAVSKSLNWVE